MGHCRGMPKKNSGIVSICAQKAPGNRHARGEQCRHHSPPQSAATPIIQYESLLTVSVTPRRARRCSLNQLSERARPPEPDSPLRCRTVEGKYARSLTKAHRTRSLSGMGGYCLPSGASYQPDPPRVIPVSEFSANGYESEVEGNRGVRGAEVPQL